MQTKYKHQVQCLVFRFQCFRKQVGSSWVWTCMGLPIGALALTAGFCTELEALWAPWESWDHADKIHPLDGCVFKGVAPHRHPNSQTWLTAPTDKHPTPTPQISHPHSSNIPPPPHKHPTPTPPPPHKHPTPTPQTSHPHPSNIQSHPSNIHPHPTNIPPPPTPSHTHILAHTLTYTHTSAYQSIQWPPTHLHHTHTLTEPPDTPTDWQNTLTYIHWHTHTLTHSEMHWHTHTLTKHPDIHTLTHPHTTYSLTYIDTPTHWQNTPTHPHTDKIPWHTHTLTKHPDIHLYWHTHTLTKHPDIHRPTHTLTYSLTYTDTPTHQTTNPSTDSFSLLLYQAILSSLSCKAPHRPCP